MYAEYVQRGEGGGFVLKLLRYGNTNTFYISAGKKGLLVDTDWAGTLPAFYKAIKASDLTLSDITYVMATHYHPDHMGLISELRALGIKHIVFDEQRDMLHFSDGIFAKEKGIQYAPIDDNRAEVIYCADSRDFLASLGINGEVLHTPAHSEDSVSLVLDEGIAIVGDLDPIDVVGAYEDNALLRDCWDMIMARSPKTVFYSHANKREL